MIGGKFNIGSLMKNAKKVQEMMEQAQEELAKIEVSGEAGAGLVKVVVTAQHQVVSVNIADEALTESKEVLEDLLKAAFNDANQKALKITQEKMMGAGNLLGGFGAESDEE